MKYNLLGNTGVLVSELCLGAMTFGTKKILRDIGEQPQEEVTSCVRTALERGVNFIDTANAYSEGLSEIMLGKSMKELAINRQQVVIATN
jgi:aryl-alcohol dehydrogenase-like predicted oxidoreductase